MAGSKPGPAPLPSNVIQLRGNPGKRKRDAEPLPKGAGLDPPADLTPSGRTFWRRHAPELARLGLLTVNDVDSFAACCEAWAFMQQAKTELRGSSKTANAKVTTSDRAHGREVRKHPAFTVYKQAEASYLAWAREFGLTPSSRVGLPGPGDDGDDDDDLFEG